VPHLSCPACGEGEALRGQRTDDGIRITCQTCGYEWNRDTRPRCATCGGEDIVTRPQTLTAFSRGTQLSVLGWRNVPLCGTCDHDELMRSTRAGGPLAAGYQPAAVHPRPTSSPPSKENSDESHANGDR
jgi:hypothetical protein